MWSYSNHCVGGQEKRRLLPKTTHVLPCKQRHLCHLQARVEGTFLERDRPLPQVPYAQPFWGSSVSLHEPQCPHTYLPSESRSFLIRPQGLVQRCPTLRTQTPSDVCYRNPRLEHLPFVFLCFVPPLQAIENDNNLIILSTFIWWLIIPNFLLSLSNESIFCGKYNLILTIIIRGFSLSFL